MPVQAARGQASSNLLSPETQMVHNKAMKSNSRRLNAWSNSDSNDMLSRRRFLQNTAAGVAGAAAIAHAPFVIKGAAPDLEIRIGLIGCGGRGTGAVLDALQAETKVLYPKDDYHTEGPKEGASVAAHNVRVVALADVFPDRLAASRHHMAQLGVNVQDHCCFTGFDSYRKIMEMEEVNYVISATPPHFRPLHLRAAVEAGKHVFLEKPVAVDAVGVRSVIDSGEIARKKGLAIGAGTMRRRENGSRELARRIREGAIGEIIACEAIWSSGELWHVDRQPAWSDMEYQVRNWLYYTWLSGDFIVEQFVHNMDIINWVLGAHPNRAFAMGGRQARVDPKFGHIYDHFAIEYQYPNGIRCFAMDRHTNGSAGRIEEVFLGAKGIGRFGLFGGWGIYPKEGTLWKFREPNNNPYQQEHSELIDSIRAGAPINEARQLAESTLTVIMGRESAYSGQVVEWEDAMNSKQDLSPASYALGPLPVPPVPVPGQYQLV
jgi:predicted dehydrogenase